MRGLLVRLLLRLLLELSPAQADLGAPVGYLEIPSIGLYRPIYFIPLEGKNYDLTELGFAMGRVGHLDQTTWIHDSWGRVVLVGHTPGAFSDLTNVQVGDSIWVWDADGVVQYVVTVMHTAEINETQWLAPTDYPSLLLMTCYGEQRWLVEAMRIN